MEDFLGTPGADDMGLDFDVVLGANGQSRDPWWLYTQCKCPSQVEWLQTLKPAAKGTKTDGAVATNLLCYRAHHSTTTMTHQARN